ncbi:GNAT family protein [Paenibacillus sp. 11B]|uniref:GNAT family N-acetyltransferase n=1 Tax=unclassified Paenibacillus TaxID=185978 RepID=UPI00264C1267|nr:GNAT family protein [Paenibacillus sp. 11B]MDN8592673.1 GNAT family protein [Paenibacillus sp. 11B]
MKSIESYFDPFPVLETERLLLRPITYADLDEMYRYCAVPAVSEYTTWDAHQSKEDTKVFIDFIMSQYEADKLGPWGIEDKQTKKLIGSCNYLGCDSNSMRVELGYVLSNEYWGRGIMTEVVSRIIQFGFEDIGLERIQAKCLVGNIGSAKVMEKAGMKFEGVLRKYMKIKNEMQDLKMYAIIRSDYDSDTYN